jgi:cytochrome c
MSEFAFAIALALSNPFLPGAQPEADLAQSRNCLGCHGVSKKNAGPALQDIAKRYASQADAGPVLVQRVLHGSRGAWGGHMPPNQVTDAEAALLVKWILSMKPAG